MKTSWPTLETRRTFIATFSHQIIQGEEPKVINDSTVKLIYINELSEFFYSEIVRKDSENIKSHIIPHSSSHKVSEILRLLKEFKNKYIENAQVPNVKLGSFELDLFNTFISFIPKDYFPRKHNCLQQHTIPPRNIIFSKKIFQ